MNETTNVARLLRGDEAVLAEMSDYIRDLYGVQRPDHEPQAAIIVPDVDAEDGEPVLVAAMDLHGGVPSSESLAALLRAQMKHYGVRRAVVTHDADWHGRLGVWAILGTKDDEALISFLPAIPAERGKVRLGKGEPVDFGDIA